MKILRSFLPALAALLMASGACARGAVPIANYDEEPVRTSSGQPATEAMVKKAVFAAAGLKNWTPTAVGLDKIRATHVKDQHAATVEITYSAKSYSIQYADSSNLDFAQRPGGTVIHPLYNHWVKKLKLAIDSALSAF